MLKKDELKKISHEFARQYDIKLNLLEKEDDLFKQHINNDSSNIDSIGIYGGAFSSSENDGSAFVPDLEKIEFDDVDIDKRLILNRVEQNMEEALQYLEECIKLRLQYDEVGKLRNDVRFKFAEFVRLDRVHLQEVESGLYKLPWQESDDEIQSLNSSLNEFKEQESSLQSIMNGNMSNASIENYVHASARISRNTASVQRDDVQADSTITNRLDKTTESASWEQRLIAVKENIAAIEPRLDSLKRKRDYLFKDESFRARRAEISRSLAWKQIAEHARPNSPLNYDQKLKCLGERFSSLLNKLIERVKVLISGLHSVYGININLVSPSKGEILDTCALWLSSAQDELSKYKRAQKLMIFSKSTDQTAPLTFTSVSDTEIQEFKCTITIESNDLPVKAFLRGVNIELSGSYSNPITVTLTPPVGAAPTTEEITISRVCPFSLGMELNARNVDHFWNGSLVGDWNIAGTMDKSFGEIDGLIVHFWLAVIS